METRSARARCALGLGVLVWIALASTNAADAALVKYGDASVRFDASGPAGMKIEGKGSSLWTVDDGSALKVVVQLTAMSTGMSLRDKHMKEKYLETAKYPDAELLVQRGDLQFPAAGATTTAEANGTILIHGVKKPTRFSYTARKDGQLYKVTGKVHVNMKDHGIAEPGYLGVKVKPDVDVSVAFDVKE